MDGARLTTPRESRWAAQSLSYCTSRPNCGGLTERSALVGIAGFLGPIIRPAVSPPPSALSSPSQLPPQQALALALRPRDSHDIPPHALALNVPRERAALAVARHGEVADLLLVLGPGVGVDLELDWV